MICAHGISKRFGPVIALRSASLHVGAGEIVGLVGENGAGKTTTLRMLAGFYEPDTGRVEIDGHDTVLDRRAAQRRIGYIPESAPLYGHMKVGEYLRFRARLKGASRAQARQRAASAAERTEVSERMDWLIARLSRGWRQRVALADALLGDPPALLLDEPTAGLDPLQVRQLVRTIRELREGRAILVASHVLSTLSELAQRMVVVSSGRIVAEGTAEELRAKAGVAEEDLGAVFEALVSGGGGGGRCPPGPGEVETAHTARGRSESVTARRASRTETTSEVRIPDDTDGGGGES